MARDFVINGETLVSLYFGQHQNGVNNLGTGSPNYAQLGLAEDSVRVIPAFRHRDIHADDFGPDIPAEVMWQLADVRIQMRLVHYDDGVLGAAIWNGMAGGGNAAQGVPGLGGFFDNAAVGSLAPAGMMMGNGLPVGASGNYYVRLNLASPVLGKPWRFYACYLAERPIVYPLSTQRSQVDLVWRAVPYVALGAYSNSPGNSGTFIPLSQVVSGQAIAELSSSGARLWDHTADS